MSEFAEYCLSSHRLEHFFQILWGRGTQNDLKKLCRTQTIFSYFWSKYLNYVNSKVKIKLIFYFKGCSKNLINSPLFSKLLFFIDLKVFLITIVQSVLLNLQSYWYYLIFTLWTKINWYDKVNVMITRTKWTRRVTWLFGPIWSHWPIDNIIHYHIMHLKIDLLLRKKFVFSLQHNHKRWRPENVNDKK